MMRDRDTKYLAAKKVWSGVLSREISAKEADEIIDGFEQLIALLFEWDRQDDYQQTRPIDSRMRGPIYKT